MGTFLGRSVLDTAAAVENALVSYLRVRVWSPGIALGFSAIFGTVFFPTGAFIRDSMVGFVRGIDGFVLVGGAGLILMFVFVSDGLDETTGDCCSPFVVL
jgi:hypothetical protein